MASSATPMSEAERELRGKFQTVPYNPRFPNTNQMKHCWAAYVEYHKCVSQTSEDEPICLRFKNTYTTLCPEAWVEKWDTQVSEGTFPGQEVWVPEMRKKHH